MARLETEFPKLVREEEILTTAEVKRKKSAEAVTTVDIFGKEFGKCVGECIAKCLKKESRAIAEEKVPPPKLTEAQLKEISKKGIKLYEEMPSPLAEEYLTTEDIETIIEQSPIPSLVAEAISHKLVKEKEKRLITAEQLKKERLEKEEERKKKLEKERLNRIKKGEEDHKKLMDDYEKRRQERLKQDAERRRKLGIKD